MYQHCFNILFLIKNAYAINVAMTKSNLLNIRKKLDKLDNKFLDLIKKRTHLVNLVLMNKKFKKDIIDKKRIKIILNGIRKKSKKKNIDHQITQKIWISMIKAYIDYEYRKFKK